MSSEGERPANLAAIFERRRPLFWLALIFCAGIFCDERFAPALPTLGSFCLATILLVCVVALLARERLKGLAVFAGAAALGLGAGMLLHALNARLPAAADVSRRTAATPSFLWLRGTVLEVERERRPGGPVNWTLSLSALGSEPEALNAATGRVRLSLRPPAGSSESPAPPSSGIGEGDRVELRARLESPPENLLPESFDYSAWLAGQGIRRTGVIFPASVRKVAGTAWWRPDLALRRFSGVLAGRVEDLLDPEGAQAVSEPGPAAAMERPAAARAALLNALLFGRRERLDRSDREAFAVCGTAHLLAISGLHIQFLVWLVYGLLKRLRLSRRRAAWMVLFFVCAYCALAGANAPILRATVMVVLYLGATAFLREADPLNTLGAAALVILAIAPAELFSAGFQLSFCAVLALVALFPVFEEAWERRRALAPNPGAARVWPKFMARVQSALLVSLAAWLGTAPLVAWHMGRFSVLSLLVNLLAVPLNGFCMVAGLLALGAGLVSRWLAQILGAVAAALLLGLQQVNAFFAALPLASVDVPAPGWPVLLAFTGVLAWLWIARGRRLAWRRLMVLVPMNLLILNAGIFFREPPAAPEVTLLALSHGRAALVQAPGGGAALLDAGGAGEGERVAEVLRRRGISRLNVLVLSADDRDALGGAAEVLKRVPVGRVILPRAAAASSARREIERLLDAQGVPYGNAEAEDGLRGPGEVRWEFCDDGRAADVPAGETAALSVRLTLPGTRVLFLPAYSGAAYRRFLAKASDRALQAEVLCLAPPENARWPSEIATLVRRSGCRVLVAGSSSDPVELPGLDLAALAGAENLRLLAPRRSGSLRIQSDTRGDLAQALQSYRDGEWRSVFK